MSFVLHSEVIANRSQTHAFREAVNGLGTMSPETYVNVVLKAQEQFLAALSQLASEQCSGGPAGDSSRLDEMPQLALPTALREQSLSGADSENGVPGGADANDQFEGTARLMQIVSDFMDLIGKGSLDKLELNAKLRNALSDSVKERLEDADRTYERAEQEATDALGAAKDASDEAERASEVADAAGKAAEKAKDMLELAEKTKLHRRR
ncbi:hypothetical protein AU476_26740 [Cupriavidus sp. UYMSc13B]|nr:hypothetical protein AU476_26740 [Cupriavidus sp. UYMSc13B]